MDQSNLKPLVRGAYDIQKLRIQTSNRIVANFKAKLGQSPGEKEELIEAEGKRILADLRRRHRKISDGMKRVRSGPQFRGDEVIASFTEYSLIEQFIELEATEAAHFKRMGHVLEDFPIYTTFLHGVKGIGPAMAGVIISEIDIHKARHPSSLWKYAGLDVGPDGKGRSRRKEHLIQVKYTTKDGEEKERAAITFNPFLKTKLMGVLAGSFLKSSSPYRQHYDDRKNRLENHSHWSPDRVYKTTRKKNIHDASLRQMVKMFLIDLYTHWRALEGLPVSRPYHEAKLGHLHADAAD